MVCPREDKCVDEKSEPRVLCELFSCGKLQLRSTVEVKVLESVSDCNTDTPFNPDDEEEDLFDKCACRGVPV